MTDQTPFFQTRMGRVYYERTLPGLVRELTRLNETLERLADWLPVPGDPQSGPPSGPGTPADPDFHDP